MNNVKSIPSNTSTISSKDFLNVLEDSQKTITKLKGLEQHYFDNANLKKICVPNITPPNRNLSPFIKDLEKEKSKNPQKHNQEILREEGFLDRIFSIDEIENVCKKYNLIYDSSERIKFKVDSLLLDYEIDLLEKCLGKKSDTENFIMAIPTEAYNTDKKIEIKNELLAKNFALFYSLGDSQYYLINKWDCKINSKQNYKNFFKQNKYSIAVLSNIIFCVLALLIYQEGEPPNIPVLVFGFANLFGTIFAFK